MVPGPLCGGCPLQTIGHGFVRHGGIGSNGVLLVGEALGADEVVEGRPFAGKAGGILTKIIEEAVDPDVGIPLQRKDFTIGNVLCCRPPDNELTKAPYELDAIKHCAPYLDETIRVAKPKVIVALGNQALRRLTGLWGIDQLRGYIHKTRYGPVIGTYHPSYVMRGKFILGRVVRNDILKAVAVARGKDFFVKREYILDPDPTTFSRWVDANLGRTLAFDIETPYSGDKDEAVDPEDVTIESDPSFTILRISFSTGERTAISVPYIPPYIEQIHKLLATGSDKVVWNGAFDVPRLRANGAEVNGRIYDGMLAWHFLEPALPMGLKYVATFYCPDMEPWKLRAASDPAWYNAADSDMALCCMNQIRAALQRERRWGTFERHYVDLGLVLGRMSTMGVLTDPVLRKKNREAFEKRLEEMVLAMQPEVPVAVKKKKVYKSSEASLRKRKLFNDSFIEVEVFEDVDDI